ncbi:MAG: cell wall hydrolase [Sphingomonadaceae bacterium]|jgi:spore germination cell wall hydrolase CwlJ-like protein
MTFTTKAASGAAIIMLTMTAAFVGGISRADDSVPHSAAQTVAVTPSNSSSALVAYAVLQEGVSPLSTPEQQTDAPAQPEKSYNTLSAMVADTDVSAPLDEQARCLASAVFYESRSETLEGQLAVARVIINRAKSERFRPTLCGVVAQPGQFSFVRGGVVPQPNVDHPQWKRAVAISHIALNDGWDSAAEGALYFHARRVKTAWARPRAAVIDNHIFYR